MVPGKKEQLFPLICAHNGSRIAHICNVDFSVNHEHDDRTGTRAVVLCLSIYSLKELLLRAQAACGECLGRVRGKRVLHNDDLVQVVLQEVGAGMAPVAVVDREVGAFGPLLALLLGWLRHVQDY